MAQLHYGDMEARRQLTDVDHDQDVNLQGEGYAVFSDDQKRRPNSPPPRSSEAPLQLHHQRNDAISGTDLSSPLTVPSDYGTLPVTSGYACDYGNLDLKPEEARISLPAARPDEGRFDRSGVPKEESMAKELQDQSASGGGIIDVHSLKDDYVDLSEGNTNQQASADVPTDPSAEMEGVIDFNSIDLTEGSTIQQTTDAAAAREATAQLTSEIKSPVDDPKQEQTSQIHAPIVDPEQEKTPPQPADDSKQEGSQPCNESHGCQSFEGDDGREKINVEGYNIYSGEPENVVYDAAEVLSGQPERALNQKDDGTQDTREIDDDIKHEEKPFRKDDEQHDIKQEEKPLPKEDEHVSREVAPENLVYDAEEMLSGQPERALNEKDDGTQDTREVDDDIKHEEKPFPKDDEHHDIKQEEKTLSKEDEHLSREVAREYLVEDASYVMGGQPESGVVVDDASGQDRQDAFSGKPPLEDMRDLPEGKPENVVYDAESVMGAQPGRVLDVNDDGVSDSQEILGEQQEQKPFSNEVSVNARSLQTDEGAGTFVEQTPLPLPPLKEETDVRDLPEDRPENAVYDAAAVMGGQPGRVVDFTDVGVHDSQAVLGDEQEQEILGDQQEQKPFSNEASVNARSLQTDEGAGTFVEQTPLLLPPLKEEIDVRDLPEGKPENAVYDAAAVMGGQPGRVVDFTDVGVHDSQAALGDEQEQKPLSNEESVNARGSQKVEGADTWEQKPLQQDSRKGASENSVDGLFVLAGQPESGAVQDSPPLKEEIDVRDLPEGKPENAVYDAAAVMGGQPGRIVDVTDVGVHDSQAVLGDEQEQKPLSNEESVNARGPQKEEGADNWLNMQDGSGKSPFKEETDTHGLSAGKLENVVDVLGDVKQEQKLLLNEENANGRGFQMEEEADTPVEQEPIPKEENVHVREMQAVLGDVEQEQKLLANEENVDVREFQTDDGVDTAVEQKVEQKPLPIDENVDVRDMLAVLGDVEQEQKLVPNEGNVDVRELQTQEGADTGVEQKPLPNEENVDVRQLQTDEGVDIPVESEDKASIADVQSDFQTGMRQVRNPDHQPLFDDDVDVQGALLSKDMPEVPKQPVTSGEEVKEVEQKQEKRNIAVLGEEQKDMAGEQYILNALDVDYNSMNVPVEPEAELKVDGQQDRGLGLKDAEGASAESPYTEFDRAHDYVKVGYGGEGFVPKNNEEVDTELRAPLEQEEERRRTEVGYGGEGFVPKNNEEVDTELRAPVEQMEERRRTEAHPLDKTLVIDAYGVTDGKPPSGDVHGVYQGGKADASRPPADEGKLEEAADMKSSEFGEYVPVQASLENKRPPTMPHPQPQDLAGYLNNNNNNNAKDMPPDEAQHSEDAPHKKNVFERIKDKLTHPMHEQK